MRFDEQTQTMCQNYGFYFVEVMAGSVGKMAILGDVHAKSVATSAH